MVNRVSRLTLLAVLCQSQLAFAACQTDFTPITAIQGSGEQSPLLGQQITTQGVVSAHIYPGTKAAGLMLRDVTSAFGAQSRNLFIADSTAVSRFTPGQKVQVSGTVTELQNLTSLNQVQQIIVCEGTANLAPLPISLPVNAEQQWEQLEGEWVSFAQPLVVNDTYGLGRYGEIIVADRRLQVPTEVATPGKAAATLATAQQLHTLLIDDGLLRQNPEPLQIGNLAVSAATPLRVGDSLGGVEGIILQNARGYFLFPTAKAQHLATNPRPAAPDAKPTAALRIASFNVLNYFNGALNTPAFPTKRGADSAEEFSRQQAKTVNALAALDADVIGLLEVENNGYSPEGALANLTTALNKVASRPYRFIITTEQPGGDDIKVALLYRPSTVSVEGKAAMLLSAPFDWGSRPPLAQNFRHLGSNELVTVSINHFKSKGSCPKDGKTADADQHDGQGCWNALRVSSAKALNSWLQSQPTGINTEKQIILGDFNAYRLEDPITTLSALNWQYLGAAPGKQHSYVFRGRSGTLDHALASPALAAKLSTVQHWSINADEPTLFDYNLEHKSAAQQQLFYAPDPYRSSDHDPLIATFNF